MPKYKLKGMLLDGETGFKDEGGYENIKIMVTSQKEASPAFVIKTHHIKESRPSQRRKECYNYYTNGKTIEEISNTMGIRDGSVLNYIAQQYNNENRDFFICKFNLNKEKLKTIIDLSSQYWEIEDNECRKQYWDLILIPGCSKLICSKNVNNISLLVRIARYLYFIDHQNVIK